jgi:hypothetical protein
MTNAIVVQITSVMYTLSMKLSISFGIIIVSTIGGWIGALMDHGNWFGGWSLVFSCVGSFVGIWAGYKVYRYFN